MTILFLQKVEKQKSHSKRLLKKTKTKTKITGKDKERKLIERICFWSQVSLYLYSIFHSIENQ